MWLVHVDTHQLEEFFNDTPLYAILSHTWSKGEVVFQDLKTDSHKQKLGYAKIEGCCREAKNDGFLWQYLCIDKTSSAELSEMINSTFRWYEAAEVCYSYLEDLLQSDEPFADESAFRKSRWFTRG